MLFRFMNRWAAQRRDGTEQRVRDMAEDIVMNLIDVNGFTEQDAERLKMKVIRVLLKEEMSNRS